jgi:spore maturation protein CgeB
MANKRVAIYYENGLGRNDGFPLYAYNLLKDKSLYPTIDAVHLLPDGRYKGFEKMDLNIIIDWGEDGLTQYLPYEVQYPTDAPLAYFASDTHLGKEYRFEMASKADYAFFAQKPAVEEYKPSKKNKHVSWLPHGVEPRAFPSTPAAPKKYDVSFVGHLVSGERIDFLDRAFKEFPNFWFGQRLSRYVNDSGQADDCADIFRKTKVVLNPPTRGDINMRIFEALATGSFIVTERVPGLEDMYQDKVHMAMYSTEDEAMELIKYYLEHEEERKSIAKSGMERTLECQTYKNRIDTILKESGILPDIEIPKFTL